MEFLTNQLVVSTLTKSKKKLALPVFNKPHDRPNSELATKWYILRQWLFRSFPMIRQYRRSRQPILPMTFSSVPNMALLEILTSWQRKFSVSRTFRRYFDYLVLMWNVVQYVCISPYLLPSIFWLI